jgi:hypothetical protein
LKLYTPFFVIGLIGSLWQHKKLEHILLIFFSLSLLIFLSFSSIMYNWYLLPSMPFWSLLMAYSAYLLLRIATLRKYMRVVLVLLNLGIAAFMFFKVVLPDLKGNSTYYQVMAANKIKELSKPTDVVVRMDDLYPTTIYYTDRKVYSSPYQKNQQYWLFIYRYTVAQGIKNHEYQWLSGKEDDINAFLPKNVCPSWQMIKPSPSSDEVIVHFN